MKILIGSLATVLLLSSCSERSDQIKDLSAKVDSLERALKNVYTPGVGEFMSSIQVHHEKIWFAAKAENWKLAAFEQHEIEEAVEGVKSFATDSLVRIMAPMIDTALSRVGNAIKAHDVEGFSRSFTVLTETCNNCHKATNHEFNVITIPQTPPFTNQLFSTDSPKN